MPLPLNGGRGFLDMAYIFAAGMISWFAIRRLYLKGMWFLIALSLCTPAFASHAVWHGGSDSYPTARLNITTSQNGQFYKVQSISFTYEHSIDMTNGVGWFYLRDAFISGDFYLHRVTLFPAGYGWFLLNFEGPYLQLSTFGRLQGHLSKAYGPAGYWDGGAIGETGGNMSPTVDGGFYSNRCPTPGSGENTTGCGFGVRLQQVWVNEKSYRDAHAHWGETSGNPVTPGGAAPSQTEPPESPELPDLPAPSWPDGPTPEDPEWPPGTGPCQDPDSEECMDCLEAGECAPLPAGTGPCDDPDSVECEDCVDYGYCEPFPSDTGPCEEDPTSAECIACIDIGVCDPPRDTRCDEDVTSTECIACVVESLCPVITGTGPGEPCEDVESYECIACIASGVCDPELPDEAEEFAGIPLPTIYKPENIEELKTCLHTALANITGDASYFKMGVLGSVGSLSGTAPSMGAWGGTMESNIHNYLGLMFQDDSTPRSGLPAIIDVFLDAVEALHNIPVIWPVIKTIAIALYTISLLFCIWRLVFWSMGIKQLAT